MNSEKSTESEEILEYRFASDESVEGDYSYNEAIMGESISDFLKEETSEASKS